MKRTTTNNDVTFKIWVREAKVFAEATFKGRVYLVHGHEIVLFPISVMALAIGRDRKTLVDWETVGTWPKPKWKLGDKKTKRWYSKAQILEAHRIHWQICSGNYGKSHSRHFDLLEFHKRIRANWHLADAELIKLAKGSL